jgi:CTP:molybdopterin cytidylyltransferase MocA
MSANSPTTPNPKRVAAGRRNRLLRKEVTPEGRERLRQAALTQQPWRFSTGPRTAAGKAASAKNGKRRQKGEQSVRELHATVADMSALIQQMRQVRARIATSAKRSDGVIKN